MPEVTQTLRDLTPRPAGSGVLLGTPLPHLARDPVQVIQDRLCAIQPVLHYLARGPVPCSLGVRGLPPRFPHLAEAVVGQEPGN